MCSAEASVLMLQKRLVLLESSGTARAHKPPFAGQGRGGPVGAIAVHCTTVTAAAGRVNCCWSRGDFIVHSTWDEAVGADGCGVCTPSSYRGCAAVYQFSGTVL